jgi:hypothetical protein
MSTADSSNQRESIHHGISAQIAPFTGASIVDMSLRYMSTTRWYHLGEIVRE